MFDSSDSVTECFTKEQILYFVKCLNIQIKGIRLVGDKFKYKVHGKPIIVFKELIDVSYMDRDEAICVIDGKVYKGDCHQNCLDDYLLEHGTSLKEKEDIDLGSEEGFAEAVELTHGCFYTCKMYGFDIYKDKNSMRYLIAHFESNFIACYDWAIKYAYENNLILGTYKDSNNEVYVSEVIDL